MSNTTTEPNIADETGSFDSTKKLLDVCDLIDQFALKEEAATWFGSQFVEEAKSSLKEVENQLIDYQPQVPLVLLKRCLRAQRNSYITVQNHTKLRQSDVEFLKKFGHISRIKWHSYECGIEEEKFVRHIVSLLEAIASEDEKFKRYFVYLTAKFRMAVKKLAISAEKSSEFKLHTCKETLQILSDKARQFSMHQQEVAASTSAAAMKAGALLSEIKSQLTYSPVSNDKEQDGSKGGSITTDRSI